ncbi:hypothetical protein B2J93_6575 [Marssonina coronariae]|uniref:Uncharacterized protein n=1 Tax=Diplocarpon coronariae TaxID=2795749 RepID=A0A218Z1H6_9HELO|nr:hypothetical protein B2J93_6575 [Marssonina coronariae]
MAVAAAAAVVAAAVKRKVCLTTSQALSNTLITCLSIAHINAGIRLVTDWGGFACKIFLARQVAAEKGEQEQEQE